VGRYDSMGDPYNDRTTWQEDLIPDPMVPRKRKDPRANWPDGLKKFFENYNAFFVLESVKSYPGQCVAKFWFDIQQPGIYSRSEIARLLSQCGGSGSVYPDSRPSHSHIMWLRATFPSTGAVFEQNQPKVKKETKTMNEDTEFYLALLQSSGVKMVVVFLGKQEYNYLAAIDVKKGDHVIVQARDQMMVGEVEEVLEEWDMDIVENLGGELKWIINTVDVSNAKLYEEQKKQVFRDLRQSRLVQKAKSFAGNANLDFNSLVQKTQNSLAIEHSDVVYETPPSAPGGTV